MSLKIAIEKFRLKRLEVYRADPIQITRDTKAANRAAVDHTGRWMLELLQNSDDARAREIRIIDDGESIYFADNGDGFKPSAVESISGTDFTDKTTNTIGRKGIGFNDTFHFPLWLCCHFLSVETLRRSVFLSKSWRP